MKYLAFFFIIVLLAGVLDSCKHPTQTNQTDTTMHVDTTHHAMDTTSHNFTWKEYTIPSENNLTGVWVFGPRDIITVNDVLYRFNGYSWVRWDLPTDAGHNLGALSGFSIFGFTPNDFWLTFGGILYHYDGTVAHEIRLDRIRQSNGALLWEYPTDGSIHSAWGTSSKDMYFVGDSGTILHFDGTNWMKFPKVTSKNIGSVCGAGSSDVWAAGFDPRSAESILLHYDGINWDPVDLASIGDIRPGNHGLGGVWCTDSSGHPIVYASGSLIWHQKDRNGWVSDSAKVDNYYSGGFIGLYYMQGNNANDLLVAADGGMIYHWNGHTWYRYNNLYSPGDFSYSTHGISIKGNTACVVGWKNSLSWIAIGQR